jgi:hypothetical protein
MNDLFLLNLIQQYAQGGSWARVPENPFPRGVAVQLGKQSGQIREELCTLRRRQILDRRFDFLHGTHCANLPYTQDPDKPASRPSTDDGHCPNRNS